MFNISKSDPVLVAGSDFIIDEGVVEQLINEVSDDSHGSEDEGKSQGSK